MPYSIAGPSIQVMKGDTNEALQSVMTAYGHMNDAYDKLAKLPGMAKTMVQDDADARYTAALNRYANDPNGLAQALANNQIDTSNVRAETLGKTQDTLSNIQKTYSTGYLQNRLENYNSYLDNPENAKALELAQQAAYHGDAKTVNDFIANYHGPAELLAERISKFNPQTAQDEQERLDISRAGIGAQWANVGIQQRKYADELASIRGRQNYAQLAQLLGANQNPNMYAKLNEAITTGAPIEINGKWYPTTGIRDDLLRNQAGWDFWKDSGGYGYLKASGTGNPNAGRTEEDQSDVNLLLNSSLNAKGKR